MPTCICDRGTFTCTFYPSSAQKFSRAENMLIYLKLQQLYKHAKAYFFTVTLNQAARGLTYAKTLKRNTPLWFARCFDFVLASEITVSF